MKLREGEPWIPPPDYGRSLRGLTINLLVRDLKRAVQFGSEVLGATVVYVDADFAVLRHGEAEWMLHADHAYLGHPLHASLRSDLPRGIGIELRLHGCDPDRAEAAARELGYPIIAPAKDKPHGLREAYIIDGEGCVWVPDVPIR